MSVRDAADAIRSKVAELGSLVDALEHEVDLLGVAGADVTGGNTPTETPTDIGPDATVPDPNEAVPTDVMPDAPPTQTEAPGTP